MTKTVKLAKLTEYANYVIMDSIKVVMNVYPVNTLVITVQDLLLVLLVYRILID